MPTGKGPLRTAIEDFLESYGFYDFAARIIHGLRENDEVELVNLLNNILDVTLQFVRDDPVLTKLFKDMKERKHQVGAALLAAAGSTVVGGVTGSLLQTLLARPTMGLNRLIRPALLDPQTNLRAFYYGIYDRPRLLDSLSAHGFPDYVIDDMANIGRQRLDAPQFIQLGRRLPERASEFDEKAKQRGWHPDDLSLLKPLTYSYPTVQDWILFAVREATEEDRARELNLDAAFPETARIEAEKSGLAPGYFKYFWRSHWQLPPATMGFEFLHRFWNPSDPLHFSDEDLSKLLIALDYAPIWHSRLRAISTSLLTRVDLRRIRKAGLVDDDFMYSEARASGYDDFRARKIVEWWNWENNQDVIDLTKSQIEKGYKTGVLKLREANDALKIAEPNEATRQFLFALWDNDIQLERTEAEIDLIRQEYIAGQYGEDVLISKLNALGLAATQKSTLLLQFDVARRKAIKHLSRTEIEMLYEHNKIDANTARIKFEGMGYPRDEVDGLMFIIDHNAQKARAKELLDAQKEQERLALSPIATQYQVDISAKNVAIAEIESQIADLKLIAVTTEDEEIMSGIAETVLELKVEIANLNIEKAQIALRTSQARQEVIG